MPGLWNVSVAEWKPMKPLPASMRLQQLALALIGDGIAGSVKSDGVVLVQIALEHRRILAANDFDAVLLAQFHEDLFGVRILFTVAIHHGMHKAGAASEIEHFLLLPLGGGDPAQREGRRSKEDSPSG